MSKRVRVLGFIHAILGGGGLAGCIALYLWMWRSSDAGNIGTLHVVGQVFLMLSACLLLPGFIGGLGLLLEKKWAPVVMIILSMLLLVVISVGTILGGYGLWALLCTDPSSAHPPHAERPQPTVQSLPPFTGQTGLLLAIIGVGAAFIVVLNVGFLLTKQKAPPELSDGFFAASVVLLLVIVAAVVKFRRRGGSVGAQSSARRARSTHAIEAETRQPAPLQPNTANGNTDGLVTCNHLQPLERAMRSAGINFRADYRSNAKAICLINLPEISHQFGIGISALYEERREIDRSYLDPKTALFWCGTCQSRLATVHPEAVTAHTPWFPVQSSTTQRTG